jgi:hypothetical protein
MLLYLSISTYDRYDKRIYNVKVWQLMLLAIILFIPFANTIIPFILLIAIYIDYKCDGDYYFKSNSKLVTKIYYFLNREIWKQKQ